MDRFGNCLSTERISRAALWGVLLTAVLLLGGRSLFAQVDQGTITGVVQDTTGAVIAGAQLTLTATDTNLVLHTITNQSGIYVFSPIKIGNYKVSATAQGFATAVQENIRLDLQERLNIVLTLSPGTISQTVTVTTAPPLLQTQSGSVGQVLSTDTINNTPLNGRNWVYMIQLTPEWFPQSTLWVVARVTSAPAASVRARTTS